MDNIYRQRPNVEKHMSYPHVKDGVVPAGKAATNIFWYYIDIDYSLGNPTFTPTIVAKENSRIIIELCCSFGISTKEKELYLPSF
jgi:hypothetical protein